MRFKIGQQVRLRVAPKRTDRAKIAGVSRGSVGTIVRLPGSNFCTCCGRRTASPEMYAIKFGEGQVKHPETGALVNNCWNCPENVLQPVVEETA